MKKLQVYIEILGEQRLVGHIAGSDYTDARFQYENSNN